MKSLRILSTFLTATALFLVAGHAMAATLRLNPGTGVYTVGTPFTVSILIGTDGKPVNAADGSLSFNPRELQVVGVSRAASIFSLWTAEPSFSNAAGTISFSGGSPSGYTGSAGMVATVTFKPLGAGTPKVNFQSGSILAADGLGTNVLTGMSGGTYTVSAPTENPEPEYITPPNTPKAPVVTSTTHPDQSGWYKSTTAKLAWDLPSGVTAVRTLLDSSPSTIPTKTYDDLITEKTIDDLDEGVSYFHIQFKNAEGWGKITHYRLGVDTEAPKDFTIAEADASDSPERALSFDYDDVSPVVRYKIQIDGKDPIDYADEKGTKRYTVPPLSPGYHTFIVEAFDGAGNSTIATYSMTIEAFEKPILTDYPSRIDTDVIPAIKGTTRPHATVAVSIVPASAGDDTPSPTDADFTVTANDEGEFVYIPDHSFTEGVYLLSAVAKDEFGRMSERSDVVRLLVEKPGYIRLGSMVVNALSVIVPLLALLILLVFGTWYLWHRLANWAKRVRKETKEAEASLAAEFDRIVRNLDDKVTSLRASRKGKLTKAEAELIDQIEGDLKTARSRIGKEVGDIEDIVS
ncbi:MAG TPA: cohesin domain-containing protein [Candidatus Paceibacterota bacterium]|nr:cohesin domain-containing protein [Candidatus Paceibacterota bacterium]